MKLNKIDINNIHRIGSFNCQGIATSDVKKRAIADDFERYHISALSLQEIHLKGYGMLSLLSSSNKEYHLYYSGTSKKSENGVGILIKPSKDVTFTPVCDRICYITTKICNKQTLHIVSVYAPTLERSEKNPELREAFYNKLNSVLKTFKTRHIVIICGDFNAKVGVRKNDDTVHQICGSYGKGNPNSNGDTLLNFAKSNNLVITNTFFKHKIAHRTTWQSPNGKQKNQIDFILIKKNKEIRMIDSRSYGGMHTSSDHKLVLLKCCFKWPFTLRRKKKDPRIDLGKLKNPELSQRFKEEVDSRLGNQEGFSNQEKWDQIVNTLKETAKDTLGTIKRTHREVSDPEIKVLSEKQKNLKLQISNETNNHLREGLKLKRNQIITKIHDILKKETTEKIDQQLKQIEQTKDDSTRMFSAIKQIQKFKPKKKLLIKTKEGSLTANEQHQAKLIAEHFKSQFNKEGIEQIRVPPKAMRNPFTADEIRKAVKKLKNGKSAGIDELKAELLKHSPDAVMEKISNLINNIAVTGDNPKEVAEGVLAALQKPGKKKGPLDNLRPIMLLSMLRKIIANCLRERIMHRIDAATPISQAAYRKGRSTTEHVFATKTMAEKSTSSTNHTTHLLMLDMSKAFDTVDRTKLLQDLNEVLEDDELHLISILLNTKITVRCGDHKSEPFGTNTGVPQGDSLSANEFTFYLGRTLPENLSQTLNNQQPLQLIPALQNDHAYSKQPDNSYNVNQEYADDMSFLSTSQNNIEYIKHILPPKLLSRNLKVNETKTEQYEIKRNGPIDGKSCKLLGTLLDTTSDIKRRKALAISAIGNMKFIFCSKLSIEIKVRAFKCYVESIFLYNCELWTHTTTTESMIDSFHRRLLRDAVHNVKWPKIMKNEDVYKKAT